MGDKEGKKCHTDKNKGVHCACPTLDLNYGK